ncbi:MAG TPA: tRNA-dihydrouridine synthase family protein [Chitinispirillaceae bacterium]|nr:tRNA-dihydrouridine synthase family protein [Chitinispirillaceae bacterium]
MAGLTHSAFRRLLSDFGGYGGLYTEMLSARALLVEDLDRSPFTRKRDSEGKVVCQLKLSGNEPLKLIVERLASMEPFAIDINLGCPAPAVKKDGCGKSLFDNLELLRLTLDKLREYWSGILTVKCRLGNNQPGWEKRFLERIKLFEQCGIDGIAVHPRFSDEKLKREARWNLFSWISSQTSIPLIANGDMSDNSALELVSSGSCDALMIGRMAVVKPWIFREMCGETVNIDYKEVWNRHLDYICEDFSAEKGIGRIKEFTSYYARNFFFGHELFRTVQSAPSIELLRKRGNEFLSSEPQLCAVKLL